MYKNGVTIEIVTNNGNKFTEYDHHNNNTYIEGRENSEFNIRITNNNNFRIEVVTSIDGIDVINGQEASFKNRGYIIKAHSTEVISGYRVSDDTIRKFCFSTKGYNNYVSKIKGNTNNTGVIGVAVFPERHTIYRSNIWAEAQHKSTLSRRITDNNFKGHPGVSCMDSTISPDMGTNMGRKEYSKVTNTYFVRNSDTPESIFTFQYRSRKVLKNMGIIIHSNYEDTIPSAFPQENYCREV